MAALRLKSYEFRKEREQAWRKLESLVDRAERKGLGSLSGADLKRLPQLYRSALSSLNVARSISLDKNLLDYLQALCQRAYFCVYGVRRHLREILADFFLRAFPEAVRRFRWHLAAASAFLLIGVLAGFLLTKQDPDRFYAFVSADMANGRDPEASTAALRETLFDSGGGDGMLSLFASFLFTHNSRVAMLCFALGFIAGIPVFLLLLTTGLMLGAFAALFASRGLGLEFWSWILPHGITELLAIVLSGGAGLVLAQSLVFPGRLRRLQNLARRGREAGVIVLGCVGMLLVAGLLEGYFRQLVQDVGVRYFVACATASFWLWYFVRVGSRRAPR